MGDKRQRVWEGIEIIKECSPGLPDLLADPGMIEHGLVNIIQNSIHATSKIEPPVITIRTYQDDEQISIEIDFIRLADAGNPGQRSGIPFLDTTGEFPGRGAGYTAAGRGLLADGGFFCAHAGHAQGLQQRIYEYAQG